MNVGTGRPAREARHRVRRSLAYLLFSGLAVVFLFDLWCGIAAHPLAVRRAALKKDYSVVNNIRYGLLSVDRWRDAVQAIAVDRIRDFTLTDDDEAALASELTSVINRLVSTADSLVQQSGKSLGGKIKKLAINTFVDCDKLHRDAPTFVREAVREMNKPDNRTKMQDLAIKKLDELAAQTGEAGPAPGSAVVSRILGAYHVSNIDAFDRMAEDQINALQSITYRYAYILIGSMILFLMGWPSNRASGPLRM